MQCACKKVKFGTQADAEFYIQKIKNRSNRPVIPIRAYQCKGGVWHITSQKDYSKEIEELKLQIEKLTTENQKLKNENISLRNGNTKEMIHEVKVDVRIQNMKQKLNEKERQLNSVRKDNAELIGRIIQLEKRVTK